MRSWIQLYFLEAFPCTYILSQDNNYWALALRCPTLAHPSTFGVTISGRKEFHGRNADYIGQGARLRLERTITAETSGAKVVISSPLGQLIR